METYHGVGLQGVTGRSYKERECLLFLCSIDSPLVTECFYPCEEVFLWHETLKPKSDYKTC